MIKRNGMFSLTLYQLREACGGATVNYLQEKIMGLQKHWRSAPWQQESC
ncbi:hypothetical protein KCP70_17225 [Salmonella enterica subsp. enterica]|nr:hypothetical protein KCP70_17225 [Salmonella enterica subsp. enterica]